MSPGTRSLRPRPNSRGQSIVALLVVIAILLALYVLFLGRRTAPGPGGAQGKVVYVAAMDKAKGVECRSNLQQIRSAITMFNQTNETMPRSLTELTGQGIPASMLRCPVAQVDYRYDPARGLVQCPFPQNNAF